MRIGGKDKDKTEKENKKNKKKKRKQKGEIKGDNWSVCFMK